ncbi:MAG: SUMF1/EgtB/PvdO family nonheme iron enzyme [Polyangiales bacterium]
MAHELFIAHASADKPSAIALYDALVALGVHPFLDARSISPGERWDVVIPRALRDARATIALVSASADDAFYLGDEIAAAIVRSRESPGAHAVIPVYVDGTPADPFTIPYGIRVLQGIDARKLGGLDAVARRLRDQLAKWRGAPPTTTPPASPTPPRTFEPSALHAALCRLLDAQFETAVLHAGLDRSVIAAPTASLSRRALDVVGLVMVGGEPVRERVTAAIERVTAPPREARALEDDELHRRLRRLPAAELDAILTQAAGPDALAEVAPVTADASARVLAAIQHLRAHPAARERAVDLLGGDDPVARWIEWGLRRYREVPVLGFRGQVRLTLDEVFVQLQVSAGVAEPLRYGRDSGVDAVSSRTLLPTDALALARRRGHAGIVLLGDPGSGKTTLLQHLYTRVALGDGEALGVRRDAVPVLIRFASITEKQRRSGGLGDVLAAEATRAGYLHAAPALRGGRRPVVFLLDGLDEVRDEATRVETCRWLDDELAHFPGAAFIVTCRYAAWRRDATLSNRFLPVDVLLLDDMRVREYVGRWFRAVSLGLRGVAELSDEEALRRADARAEKVLAVLLSPARHAQLRLRDLTGNPLLLSTLCLVAYEDNDLPERRSELYDRCVRLLLEAWTERRAGKPALPDGPARLVLQPLAWSMHERDLVEATGAELLPVVTEALREVQGLSLTAREFLDRARDDCGIFTSFDIDRYRFLHLTFQEYLSACHAQNERLEDDLARHAGDARWQEVILLAVARGGLFEPFVRALVLQRLAASVDLLRECLLDTDRLRLAPFLDVLDAYVGKNIARWLASKRIGVVLAPEVRATFALLRGRDHDALRERAEALADDADAGVCEAARVWLGRPLRASAPALGEVLVELVTGMTLLWVPPGRFVMGSANDDPQAYDDEKPAHEVTLSEGFYIGQQPVTNAAWQRFVAVTGAPEPRSWQNRRFNDPMEPVVEVSHDDARAFCAWLTASSELGRRGLHVTLPTEAQWEYAARGTDGRRYPWGNEAPTKERAWFNHRDATARVGERPAGRSFFGCEDMAGNVWEWCRDAWRDSYTSRQTGRPLP